MHALYGGFYLQYRRYTTENFTGEKVDSITLALQEAFTKQGATRENGTGKTPNLSNPFIKDKVVVCF